MQTFLSGRISQKTYLKATLFTWALALNFALSVILLASSPGFQQSPIFVFFSVAALLLALGILVFSIQLQVRRWHDLGKGGHWLWVNFIPFVSLYYQLVLLFRDGELEDNIYGLKPIDEGSEYVLQLVTSIIALAFFAPLT